LINPSEPGRVRRRDAIVGHPHAAGRRNGPLKLRAAVASIGHYTILHVVCKLPPLGK
jgi:hypothetical protein